MIIKKGNVETVDYELYGEKCVGDIHQKNGVYLSNKLPCKMEITANFRVMHVCRQCAEKISYGNNGDFVYGLDYITTKFYTKDFVLAFIDFFKNTVPIYMNNHIYIYRRSITPDPILTATGSISLSYSRCKHCGAEYLYYDLFASPYFPDPGCPEGRIGFYKIYEIIQMELDNGKNFKEWEYENRLKKD